jgi:hypothetical protein
LFYSPDIIKVMRVEIGQYWRYIGPDGGLVSYDTGEIVPGSWDRSWSQVVSFQISLYSGQRFALLANNHGITLSDAGEPWNSVATVLWEPLQPPAGFASSEWVNAVIDEALKVPA